MKNKSLKHVFLLSKSVLLPDGPLIGKYDFDLDMNTSIVAGKQVPSVVHSNSLGTQSKTFAAPGDDDPDRDADFCY